MDYFVRSRRGPNNDEKRRRAGFKVHSRPTDGPAMWIREGKLFTAKAALKIANAEYEPIVTISEAK